ncbi:MAG: hypothetical protein JWM97_278 [Phycisphaerales bacterium]|nr:hypothetical protein [Phycisphaerales bacterium]MDB5302729.1 hypothetical protein [Phycisphaerales bacterium]
MTRTTMTQAVAADYADAMLVARRAKNTLFLFLALILIVQLAMFFVARYVHSIHLHADVTATANPVDAATTRSSTDTPIVEHTLPTAAGGSSRLSAPAFEYLIALTDYGGVVFTIVLAVVLLLIITIMLVGRLVGVSHVTSAFCWAVFLMVLMFPWQAFLNSEDAAGVRSSSSTQVSGELAPDTTGVRIPGVLYTWPELRNHYDFPSGWNLPAILKWARFVGFPLLALVVLLMIQGRSSRGLRFALGEAEVQVTEPTGPGGMGT